MEFCQKCGSMILVNKNKAVCANCGFKPKKKPKIEASEKIEKSNTISVIKEGQDNTYPIVEIKCIKCKNNKAFFWTSQTRAADEAETKFYKCKKCSHTWRVYK
jgi:transcription factor S